MICTIRIPDVLQARIDTEAGKGNRSEWILEACRMRLDGGSSKRPEPEPATGQNAQKDTSYGAGYANAASVTAMGDSQPRPNIQALRDICAGTVLGYPVVINPTMQPIPDIVLGSDILPNCTYTEYDPETGETYGCRLRVHPPKIKHQRGASL